MDVLELSSRIIDTGVADEPTNRISQELSELDDGVAIVESFSHVVAFATDDGLVCFDSSSALTGGPVVEALRRWRTDPVHSLVYTHGHVDHVGGSEFFLGDAAARGHRPPRVVGHDNVAARFERYEQTDGYNRAINARQFGGGRPGMALSIGEDRPDPVGVTGTDGIAQFGGRFLPSRTARPTLTFSDAMRLEVGGLGIELHHARGETDDHLWAWVPERRAICAGDFVIWNFPNAGNPQKVQRYPLEWAAALRAMAARPAELLLPAHGLPVQGSERIQRVLGDAAAALEGLVADVLELMNQGATLDTILHTVRVDPALLERPWLGPRYDEPEFVIRNIWRLYGGWWDGDPAQLKPPRLADAATELAHLAGGAEVLARRAQELAGDGDLRLACQLVELAGRAAPDDPAIHGVRAEIYRARRRAESSLMAKGVYGAAARDSEHIAGRPPG